MSPLLIFLTVAKPIAKVLVLVLVAYVAFRRGWLPRRVHTLMSKTVLYVTLPALLFAKLTTATELFDRYPNWYWLPLSAGAVYVAGGGLGMLLSRFTLRKRRDRALCALMCTFHNAGYLPLVIVREVFPEWDRLDVLVMLYVLGASPVLWTVCPALLSAGHSGSRFRRALNPPIITVLLAFTAMMCGLGTWMESVPVGRYDLAFVVLAPLGVIGELTIPLALFVLGGVLARLPVARPRAPRLVATLIGVKLILMPILGLAVIPLLGLKPAIAIVIIVACMQPPAVNLTVQAREFATEETAERVGESLLATYLVATVTLTLFLTILKAMV